MPPTVLVLEPGELSVTVGGDRAGTNAFKKKVGKFLSFFPFIFFPFGTGSHYVAQVSLQRFSASGVQGLQATAAALQPLAKAKVTSAADIFLLPLTCVQGPLQTPTGRTSIGCLLCSACV